jgi:glycyl-tRNA synthetase (class II)
MIMHKTGRIKKNIREYWWKSMVQMNDNIVGLDASILMHPTTWKASGHVDAFNDPLTIKILKEDIEPMF